MDSALRPREIQSRIRAGQSLEEVAQAAGVPVERIEPYAAPVLAECEHVAGLALAATVRRRGETGSHRSLRPVVTERLTTDGIDPDSVRWDAWRNENRRWSVRASWAEEDQSRTAVFHFDLPGRFSVAADDTARWLISEASQQALDDADEADELALVRAVTAVPELADSDSEPTISLPEPGLDNGSRPGLDSVTAGARTDAAQLPRSAATPLEIGEAVEAEIDGYGLIPDGRTELDVLYDMLGGIAEDSINIYAGLSDPIVPPSIDLPEPPAPEPPAPEPAAPEPAAPDRRSAAEPQPAPAPNQSFAHEHSTAAEPSAASEADPQPEPTIVRKLRRGDGPVAASNTVEQPQLTGDPEATIPVKPGSSKRRHKGRAHVPSWEEIVFGGPKTD